MDTGLPEKRSGRVNPEGRRVIRHCVGSTRAETLVLNLIRAHTKSA